MKAAAALLLASLALLASFVVHYHERPRLNLTAAKADVPTSDATGLPPLEYRGDGRTIVLFLTPPEVAVICEHPAALACAGHQGGVPVLALPNPCLYAYERYAFIACHELGHRNGWRHG